MNAEGGGGGGGERVGVWSRGDPSGSRCNKTLTNYGNT